MSNAVHAIEQWKQAIGADNVADDAATIDRYARTTMDVATRPACVLYPQSTEQVQAAVKIAAETGVVLYPISRGKNWGYGDACAPTDGAAIVDLSRMNKILEVNEELGYAVIEAGVSQSQLYQYLNQHGHRLWLDSSGAGFEASLVGNTLDRGFGHTRYGDHFLSTCGMEIVMPDARVLNTGFGHMPNARATRVYRYGIGPFIDGLFCQSNLGIITKIGLWLMPEPEEFCFYFIKLDRDEELGPLVDRLRVLRMSGLLQSAIHVANDLRVLSGTGRYPWKDANGVTPLPDDVRRLYRNGSGVGAWNAAGSLTGTAGTVKASRKALRQAMAGLGKIMFVDDRKLALGEFAVKCLGMIGLGGKLRRQLEALKPNYGLLKGIPTNEPLIGPQWRLRHPPAGACDPLDAGCGLLWASPVLPATSADANALVDMVKPIFAQFGFEMLITFTLITERAMIAITNVAFDKSNADESARARKCYDALMEAFFAKGFYPYRATLHALPKLVSKDDVFWDVTRRIKGALDPKDIIARGRYIPPLDGRQ
jgi:4-cresol dehydrogenase (hydroxylating)